MESKGSGWHGESKRHQEVALAKTLQDTLRVPMELEQERSKTEAEILRKISLADKIERSNGKDYTISDTLKNFMVLLQDKKSSKIKRVTEDIDQYVKLGLGWGTNEPKEVQDVITLVYNYAMEKRKQVTPAVDITPIDETIIWFSQFESDPYITIKKGFVSLRVSLKESWKFGLYEETQFSTPKQEIDWEIKRAKQRFKKDAFGLSEKMEQRLDAIKEYYKKGR